MKETFSKHWDELENKYEFFNRLYELLNNDSHFTVTVKIVVAFFNKSSTFFIYLLHFFYWIQSNIFNRITVSN